MLLLCLFWLTFPFYLNAQDDCSVFHEGACPLEVDLFFRLIVIAIIVVCKNQIFYKNYPVIVAQNDGLCKKVICWDCTLVYFNIQCSLLFPFVIFSWQNGVTILKTSLSSYRYHHLLRWICFFSSHCHSVMKTLPTFFLKQVSNILNDSGVASNASECQVRVIFILWRKSAYQWKHETWQGERHIEDNR